MTLTYPTVREESLNKLWDKGESNAQEILRNSFGGELPRDLDFVNAPQYEVHLRSVWSKPVFYATTALKALKSSWLWMGINYFFFHSPVIAGGIFAANAALTAASLGGFVDTENDPRTIHMNDLWAAARHFNAANGGLADAIAHESFHVLQANDARVSLSSALADNRTCLNMLFNERSGFLKYLSSECELQARLFTVVSNAYIQHRRMPLNKYELWACLASQGMTPPDKILHMAKNDPVCGRAFSLFPTSQDYVDNYSDKMAASQLNDVQDGIEADTKKFGLWDKVYPFLYGDMLEIMGDRLGQKRMGGDHNVQLREIFMKSASDHMKGETDVKTALTQMKKTADMMPADDAMHLMQEIAAGKPYKGFSEDSIFIRAGNLRTAAVFALAANPRLATRNAAFALHKATGLSPVSWKRQMDAAERMANAKNVSVPGVKPKKRDRIRPLEAGFQIPSLL